MLYSIMVLHIITMPRITQKAIGVLLISIVVLENKTNKILINFATSVNVRANRFFHTSH